MDVPPGSGLTVGPFLAVDAWLRAAGFSAPAVLAADEDRGLVLLEDLGDDLFARICARGAGARGRALRRGGRPPRRPAAAAAARRRLDAAALRPRLPAARGAAGARMVPAGGDRRPGAGRPRRRVRGAGGRGLRAVRDPGGGGLPRLPRREPDLAAGARRPRAGRAARLPGHAGRAPGLRPRLAARGRPPRRLARAQDGDARPLRRAQRRRRRGARPRGARALGAAQPQDRRAVQPAGPPRRQAALPRATCRGSGAYLAADLAHPALAPLAGLVARHMPPPEPPVLARIGAAA